MRAKVCYTLLPKLYHKCKPVATNRSAFPRRPRASSPHRRCTKSDRSHDSSRVQGELRSALRHTLDPAAPTTCDRDSVHRLPTLAQAHSARDDEDSAPPSPPTSNSTRNFSSCPRKHEALTGGSFSVRSSNRTQRDPQHRGSSAIAPFSRRKPVVVHKRTTEADGSRA
jgi:hypothetical protein